MYKHILIGVIVYGVTFKYMMFLRAFWFYSCYFMFVPVDIYFGRISVAFGSASFSFKLAGTFDFTYNYVFVQGFIFNFKSL